MGEHYTQVGTIAHTLSPCHLLNTKGCHMAAPCVDLIVLVLTCWSALPNAMIACCMSISPVMGPVQEPCRTSYNTVAEREQF